MEGEETEDNDWPLKRVEELGELYGSVSSGQRIILLFFSFLFFLPCSTTPTLSSTQPSLIHCPKTSSSQLTHHLVIVPIIPWYF